MHNLGKDCAHVVHVLCRSYLRTEYKNVRVWTKPYLYPTSAQVAHQPVHRQKAVSHTVRSRLIHTFHSTYKERKQITLKQILNNTVENFS